MHAPMPNGPIPVCPACGEAMVWDSKWIEWYCVYCEFQEDDNVLYLTPAEVAQLDNLLDN